MTSLLSEALKDLSLDKSEYLELLTKLIGETKYLQNSPRQNLVPQVGCVDEL
jgi:hypothetical protein